MKKSSKYRLIALALWIASASIDFYSNRSPAALVSISSALFFTAAVLSEEKEC